VVVAKGMR